ncbi:MAG: hypothetical protein SGJ19_26495 [Planctomycetia bacterium]|nr:hypothetical protein [Planctomycetia bacterium]
MQIPSLFAAVPAMVNTGLKLIGVDIEGKIGQSAPQQPETESSVNAPEDAFDLSSITPDDFSELIDQLRANGQLSAEGYRELLGVRLELDRARAPHDQPVDVVSLLQAKLADQQQFQTPGGGAHADLTKRQLQWLNSIGTPQGINALA